MGILEQQRTTASGSTLGSFHKCTQIFKANISYRLLLGIDCNVSRDLARRYFLKAALSDTASDKEQAIAHGLLCEWYWDGVRMPYDPNTSQRYLFAACHHANKSAELCKRVSPPGALASSAVLSSLGSMAEPDARKNDARLFYPHSLRAFEERELKEIESRQELVKKRLKHLNRYRCAAEDCDIETDSGYMLFRCTSHRAFLVLNLCSTLNLIRRRTMR